MSEETKIEWATASWNPWEGCTNWGKGHPRRRTSAANWRKPVAWNRWAREDADRYGSSGSALYPDAMRPRVFPSRCDWLDDEVPIEWLADFLKLIHDTPNLDWLLLSKRPDNFLLPRLAQVLDFQGKREGFPKDGKPSAFGDWIVRWLHRDESKGISPKPPSNVWIGTSVEDQPRADERIPELLKIPAAVRFLSVEPLLSPVDLNFIGIAPKELTDGSYLPVSYLIHWVIVGGESGPGARPCNLEWIRDIVRQCHAADVPCFVKQLGANAVMRESGCFVSEFSDAVAAAIARQPVVSCELKHPKGGDPAEWPEDLRVRQFPEVSA